MNHGIGVQHSRLGIDFPNRIAACNCRTHELALDGIALLDQFAAVGMNQRRLGHRKTEEGNFVDRREETYFILAAMPALEISNEAGRRAAEFSKSRDETWRQNVELYRPSVMAKRP
ncbi:conserved hypothetical protein [Ricinus communis]|uniref:Uncharacterized protein n=1 Tax=Ricinus communis TaxID=3988 RepID=B9TMM3_RICCO|nr:conserved hypothetical protein [Ricinus communis]